jgi:carbon storage regulator
MTMRTLAVLGISVPSPLAGAHFDSAREQSMTCRDFTTEKRTSLLILARHTHQSIEIGSDTTVKMLAVKGAQVPLGIKAPKPIPVYREDVARRIREEQSADGP